MNNQADIEALLSPLKGAYSDNTLKSYRNDARQYCQWCVLQNLTPFPVNPEQLAKHIEEMTASYKSSTIRRHINSLGRLSVFSNQPNPSTAPEVILALKRIHRKLGRAQKQAFPLTRTHLDQMMKRCATVISDYITKYCYC